MTLFMRLSIDWNAEPNSPIPQITFWDGDIILSFFLNAFIYPQFTEGDIGHLRFRNCSLYRMGTVNDEGWYRGQCRFSKLAPSWGEFYQVTGDLLLDRCPNDWKYLINKNEDQKHFLFYFRDEEFECDADSWSLSISK
jgi:hypothetical protein